jgi:hypothetical protein
MRGKPPSSDPSIKVAIHMPASVYQRLRERADAAGSNISRLLRDGALRALADAEQPQERL